MNPKVKVARLSLLSNTILIIMKLVVGLLTGSVSIISEAIHSTLDLIADVIAFFYVKSYNIVSVTEKPGFRIRPINWRALAASNKLNLS